MTSIKLTDEILNLVADFCEKGGGIEVAKLFRESIPKILSDQKKVAQYSNV